MTDFVCEVDERYRSACRELDFYAEHEGKQYCVLHLPGAKKNEDFLKVIERKLTQKDYDFGGAVFHRGTANFEGFEFDANTNFDGAIFIGAANFSGAQFSAEATNFREAQFRGKGPKGTYFYGAQFSGGGPNFYRAQFSGGETNFSEARFSGGWTSFSGVRFSGTRTSFSRVRFSGERTSFSGAQFSSKETYFGGARFIGEGTYFSEAEFSSGWTFFDRVQFSAEVTHFYKVCFSGEETDFSGARFSGEETNFSEALFNGKETNFSGTEFGSAETSFQEATLAAEATFSDAIFRERVAFWGTPANSVFSSQAWARFDRSRIDKPELLTFNTVLLHPGWFINADVRKVDFTDVKWYGMPGGPKGTLDEEIDALTKRNIESPYTLLSQACQRLAANAEENRDYRLANDFYYWSMDALRKAGWRRLGLIRTLYWALSGYGVRSARAFWVLLGIWAAFTILYILVPSSPFSGFSVSDFGEAIVYSLGAMARLNPEPRPDAPGLFQFLVTVEGLLGPLQIALLALAIRRKVMR